MKFLNERDYILVRPLIVYLYSLGNLLHMGDYPVDSILSDYNIDMPGFKRINLAELIRRLRCLEISVSTGDNGNMNFHYDLKYIILLVRRFKLVGQIIHLI